MLAVVAYHAFPDVVRGGYVGVDLFFVLSGFLITALLIGEWTGSGHIALGRFYVRRTLRLMPALVAFLVGYGLWVRLTMPGWYRVFVDWLPSLYLSNVSLAYDTGTVPIAHMWSLAAEEQFYLLWPPLLLCLLRRRVSHRAIMATTSTLCVLAFSSTLLLAVTGADAERIAYGPDSRSGGILLGCLLAQVWAWGRLPDVRRWGGAAVGAFALACLAAPAHPLTSSVAALLSAVAVVAVVQCPSAGRVLEHRTLVRLGHLSYALYLWHPLALDIAGESPAARAVAVARLDGS